MAAKRVSGIFTGDGGRFRHVFDSARMACGLHYILQGTVWAWKFNRGDAKMITRSLKREALPVIGAVALLMLTPMAARASACAGTCGTAVANGDVTLPPGFSSYYYVTTMDGPMGGGDLPAIFGSPGVDSTNGSTFTTDSFTASSGELINFYFNYVTSDGSGFPDYAWAGLMSTGGGPSYLIFSAQTQPTGNTVPGFTLPPLAPGASLTPPTSPIMSGSGTDGGPVWAQLGASSGSCYKAGCGLTGWIGSQFDGEAAGTYTLQFGVSNTNDESYDSGLAFAGVEVGGQPVVSTPEPSSLALLAAGVVTLALAVVRRRRRAPGTDA